MAVENGTDILLNLETSLVNGTLSASMENSADEIEVTTKDSDNFKEFIAGELGSTIQVEGRYDSADTYGYTDLFDAWKARAPIAFVFGGTDSGDETFSGSCIITSLSLNSPKNEATGWSATLRATGEVTKGTVTP